jgi:hypothetical protein
VQFGGFETVLIVGGVVFLAAVGLILWLMPSRDEEQRRRFDILRLDAERFFSHLQERGTLPDVAVDIVLQKGEIALLREDGSQLAESRAYRVFGGVGTRIRGVYIGGGASESYQRLRQIDTGTLILTTERLIFDGGLENRALKVKDVLSAEAWSDAIEVSSSRRQKSQVYSVGNPLIWSRMIKAVASGEIRARTQTETPPKSRPKADRETEPPEPPVYDIGR